MPSMVIFMRTRLSILPLIFLVCLIPGLFTGHVAMVHADAEAEAEEVFEDARQGTAAGYRKGQWVPVPMPVSNPTVGTGVQAVLMFLHPKNDHQSDVPNTTSGLVGLYTNTGSWFAGAFHDGYLAGDTYRISGFAGYGEFDLDYYGTGDSPVFENRSIGYDFQVLVLAPTLLKRIPRTENWFAGVSYLYLDTRSRFRTSETIPGIPDAELEMRTAGLGVIAQYDRRDDNYYPTGGQLFEAKWTNYGAPWGGDNAYNKFRTYLNHYQPIGSRTVLALRSRFDYSSGDTPFFDLPSLDMRGFAMSRYSDQTTLSVHAEGRYKFLPRWGLIGFAEAGRFANDVEGLASGRTIVSTGCGVRWQVTKAKKLNLGIDVAFSSDDSAVYVQIGESF
jgi:hypothetical protein